MAMTEQDGWDYTGLSNDGQNYVCSAFSAGLYRAAGLFDDFVINVTEFTPRDVMMLDFYAKERQRPAQCVEADPLLPYCQLMGKYRIDLTHEWSSITPYAHMNEKCPSVGPTYFRPEGC